MIHCAEDPSSKIDLEEKASFGMPLEEIATLESLNFIEYFYENSRGGNPVEMPSLLQLRDYVYYKPKLLI